MPIILDLYVEKNSFLHRVDPRVKIVFWVAIALASQLLNDPFFIGPTLASLFLIFFLGRPTGTVRKLAFSLSGFVAGVYAFWWLFLARSGNPIVDLGLVRVTDWSLWLGLGMALRGACNVMPIMILLSSTSQERLIAGLEGLKVPYPICFGIAHGFRLLPALMTQWSTMAQAQRARGATLGHGGWFFRHPRESIAAIRDAPALAVPLFVGMVRTMARLSLALDSRAYDVDGKTRTKAIRLTMRKSDWIIIAVTGLFLAFVIVMRLGFHIGWMTP